MRYFALILTLLFATPVVAQTTLYLRDGTGPISGCVGVDRDMSAARGASALTYNVPDTLADNWNDTSMAGERRDGLWDCTINLTVGTGGGPANKVTIAVDHVNSSCVVQTAVFSEVTPTLTKGATTNYACTGATVNVTFSVGDGIRFTIFQSNGGQQVDMNYNGADTNDSEVVIPPVFAATPTPTATPTSTPTATPTSTPTALPSARSRIIDISGGG